MRSSEQTPVAEPSYIQSAGPGTVRQHKTTASARVTYLGDDEVLQHFWLLCAQLQLLLRQRGLAIQALMLSRGLQAHQGGIGAIGPQDQVSMRSLLHYLPLPHNCSRHREGLAQETQAEMHKAIPLRPADITAAAACNRCHAYWSALQYAWQG